MTITHIDSKQVIVMSQCDNRLENCTHLITFKEIFIFCFAFRAASLRFWSHNEENQLNAL